MKGRLTIPASLLDSLLEDPGAASPPKRPLRRLFRFVRDALDDPRHVDRAYELVTMAAMLMLGVGGRLREPRRREIEQASAWVQENFARILPLDEGTQERIGTLEGQPAVLRLIWVMLEHPPEGMAWGARDQALIFGAAWVGVEVLDRCWEPGREARNRVAMAALQAAAELDPEYLQRLLGDRFQQVEADALAGMEAALRSADEEAPEDPP